MRGALTRLARDAPHRFERLVFFLPAVLDGPRSAPTRALLAAMAGALEDTTRLAELVAAELPAAVRKAPAAQLHVAERTARLQHPDIGRFLREFGEQVPIDDRTRLSDLGADVLVIGCDGDVLHPASVARQLAAAVPGAQLHVFPEPGPLWTARSELRDRIGGFLNAG